MNKIIILCVSLTLQNCNQNANEQKTENINAVEYRESVIDSTQQRDTLRHKGSKTNNLEPSENQTENSAGKNVILNHIQEKITKALYDGLQGKNTQKLDTIETFLENNKTGNKNLINYWIAYINYYKSIIALQLKDKYLGSKSNKKGIEILDSNKNKNSDDYALLVLLKGVSYPFVSAIEAPAISQKINKLLKKGIEADDKNFRIYYAQGSIDFYTPKEYGGGTQVEKALLKAINLPEKNTTGTPLPTWGKEEAYDLIIRFYLREQQKDKAKSYFEKAQELFPNSYTVQTHQSDFKD